MLQSHKQQSVAIVGGGIVGMSIAWHLAQAGFAVTVYDKSTIGGEASWAGAGMLAPGGEFETDSSLARLAIESRQLYRDFVNHLQRESGTEIDLQETGALDVAYSPEELAELDRRTASQAALDIATKPLKPLQIATFWPRLRKADLVGGYFYPGDCFVDPRQVVAALRACCGKAGVALLEHNTVNTIAIETGGVLVNDARYQAAVIASGAWSGMISITGVPPLPSSEPVRGHLLGYRQPEQICNTIIRHRHIYLLQRANGFFIAGATVEHVGFKRDIDSRAVSQLEQAASFLMPHLSETSPTEVWNGLRPASDSLHMGPWHSPHLHLAYGHYRNGILLAPITARRITAGIIASSQKR